MLVRLDFTLHSVVDVPGNGFCQGGGTTVS